MSRLRSPAVLALLLCFVLAGCEENDPSPIGTPPAISGALVQVDGCKSSFTKSAGDRSQGCVQYTYDPAAKKLTFLHVNAAFNCCPEVINVAVAVENAAIRLTESEAGGMCDCNCLFDLHIVVENVPAASYTVVVDEPLRNSQDPALEFPIDLTKAPEGQHCVPRNFYPWGE